MRFSVLHAIGRDTPEALPEIDFDPTSAQYFSRTSGGVQKQPHCFGEDARIVERHPDGADLGRRQNASKT